MATVAEIQAYLAANPGLTDAQIAQAAATYGVTSNQLAAATGIPVDQIVVRAAAAGTPIASEAGTVSPQAVAGADLALTAYRIGQGDATQLPAVTFSTSAAPLTIQAANALEHSTLLPADVSPRDAVPIGYNVQTVGMTPPAPSIFTMPPAPAPVAQPIAPAPALGWASALALLGLVML